MILVTGASGFVGASLVRRIQGQQRYGMRLVTRNASAANTALGELIQLDSISANTDWTQALMAISTVVHCAGRVHMMADNSADPLSAFRAVNVAGTLQLARQAATSGVQRFVFVSSVKVNGEKTFIGRPFLPEDPPHPVDDYGVSKHEAEVGLRRISEETGMEVVIIRPVLVYGPGVRGNFLAMMRWLQRGAPLPLGAINNARSLVALENLVDLIVTCLDHPAAANQTFLVSDAEDLSTTALLERTASAMGKKARLIPVPEGILQASARLFGQLDVVQRLCGSLQVDISKTRGLLGWTPPATVDQALKETAEYFLRNQHG
jgi:UDP-glucose 4-epimerase